MRSLAPTLVVITAAGRTASTPRIKSVAVAVLPSTRLRRRACDLAALDAFSGDGRGRRLARQPSLPRRSGSLRRRISAGAVFRIYAIALRGAPRKAAAADQTKVPGDRHPAASMARDFASLRKRYNHHTIVGLLNQDTDQAPTWTDAVYGASKNSIDVVAFSYYASTVALGRAKKKFGCGACADAALGIVDPSHRSAARPHARALRGPRKEPRQIRLRRRGGAVHARPRGRRAGARSTPWRAGLWYADLLLGRAAAGGLARLVARQTRGSSGGVYGLLDSRTYAETPSAAWRGVFVEHFGSEVLQVNAATPPATYQSSRTAAAAPPPSRFWSSTSGTARRVVLSCVEINQCRAGSATARGPWSSRSPAPPSPGAGLRAVAARWRALERAAPPRQTVLGDGRRRRPPRGAAGGCVVERLLERRRRRSPAWRSSVQEEEARVVLPVLCLSACAQSLLAAPEEPPDDRRRRRVVEGEVEQPRIKEDDALLHIPRRRSGPGARGSAASLPARAPAGARRAPRPRSGPARPRRRPPLPHARRRRSTPRASSRARRPPRSLRILVAPVQDRARQPRGLLPIP